METIRLKNEKFNQEITLPKNIFKNNLMSILNKI